LIFGFCGGGLETRRNCGAEDRSRTCDLLITNQLLYQLSYFSTYTQPIGRSRFVDSRFGYIFDEGSTPGVGSPSGETSDEKMPEAGESKITLFMFVRYMSNVPNLMVLSIEICKVQKIDILNLGEEAEFWIPGLGIFSSEVSPEGEPTPGVDPSSKIYPNLESTNRLLHLS
jgi:hypothetical protein